MHLGEGVRSGTESIAVHQNEDKSYIGCSAHSMGGEIERSMVDIAVGTLRISLHHCAEGEEERNRKEKEEARRQGGEGERETLLLVLVYLCLCSFLGQNSDLYIGHYTYIHNLN